MRYVLSKWVYDKLEEGLEPRDACDASLELFKDYVSIGVLAVSTSGYGVSCNTDMAWWAGKG